MKTTKETKNFLLELLQKSNAFSVTLDIRKDKKLLFRVVCKRPGARNFPRYRTKAKETLAIIRKTERRYILNYE